MMEPHQLSPRNRREFVGLSFVVREFNLEHAGRQNFDNRSDLAAQQVTLRNIHEQRHDIE